jgi:hypothetical protein
MYNVYALCIVYVHTTVPGRSATASPVPSATTADLQRQAAARLTAVSSTGSFNAGGVSGTPNGSSKRLSHNDLLEMGLGPAAVAAVAATPSRSELSSGSRSRSRSRSNSLTARVSVQHVV